jgi:CBS domain-containing protein
MRRIAMRHVLEMINHARKPLIGKTAAEMMTPNPPLLPSCATVREAASLLMEQEADAVLVTDELGLAAGVLSHADITQHYLERAKFCDARPDSPQELSLPSGEKLRGGFQVIVPDGAEVQEIMTPVVFATSPEAPLDWVAREMIARRVHQVFVIDGEGIARGVIDVLDILQAYYQPDAGRCQTCVPHAA